MTPSEAVNVSTGTDIQKLSVRDLPVALARRLSGATTVAASVYLASIASMDAEIEIFAKLVNAGSGKVIATKGFSARVPAPSDSPADAIAALNQAFTEVLQDTTTWVASRKG